LPRGQNSWKVTGNRDGALGWSAAGRRRASLSSAPGVLAARGRDSRRVARNRAGSLGQGGTGVPPVSRRVAGNRAGSLGWSAPRGRRASPRPERGRCLPPVFARVYAGWRGRPAREPLSAAGRENAGASAESPAPGPDRPVRAESSLFLWFTAWCGLTLRQQQTRLQRSRPIRLTSAQPRALGELTGHLPDSRISEHSPASPRFPIPRS